MSRLPGQQAEQSVPAALAAEREIRIRSAGLDVGSSTTHLVLSAITLRKVGSRYVPADVELLHISPTILTPYGDDDVIRCGDLERFVDAQYEAAGLRPADVATGAVILTGTALLRHNARAVADVLAARSGRCVSVSAGDRLEARISAVGSGAVRMSQQLASPVLNVDIGGGTTKIAVCEGGDIVATAAFDIGARVVAVDDGGIVRRLEPAGRLVAGELGLDVAVGSPLDRGARRRLASRLSQHLFAAVTAGPECHESPLHRSGRLDVTAPSALIFSGGVAEFICGRETRDFGDLGRDLAEEILTSAAALGSDILEADAGIHATVLGASHETVQVSGSTIFASSPDALPIWNAPVIVPSIELGEGDIDGQQVTAGVRAALEERDLLGGTSTVGVAIRWRGPATFQRLRDVAGSVLSATSAPDRDAVLLICDTDVARLLGRRGFEQFPTASITSIDGVSVGELDHVDVGPVLSGTSSVTVVVKSVLFEHPRRRDPRVAGHPGTDAGASSSAHAPR